MSSLTVTEFVQKAKRVIEQGLPLAWIKGEISGLRRAASGHSYFDLKDEGAQVSCVLYRHKLARVSVALRDGLQVEVHALPSLYEPRGSFQLMIEAVRPAGLGAQFEAFLRLKAQLEAEGLFDPARKRELPVFARRIGIITSASGAVIHDIETTAKARWPGITLILYPAAVQGVQAPESLCAALQLANARKEVDVLIIARGGGSAEDLSAFNDEAVVRAVAATALLIVSAVGHETDVTLCDFAADQRAATPTAAASLLVPNAVALSQALDERYFRLQQLLKQYLRHHHLRLALLQVRLKHPQARLDAVAARLTQLRLRLLQSLSQQMQQRQHRLQTLQQDWHNHWHTPRPQRQVLQSLNTRLQQASKQLLTAPKERLQTAKQGLKLLAPQAVLKRGYAWVSNDHGQVISEAKAVPHNTPITIQLNDGSLHAIVQKP
jgi:exodeoxyribonuclease VII large subunit